MNIKSMANGITSKVGLQMLKAKKQSPAIMFGAGVVGVVATVVLASKATLKLEEVLNETDELIEQANTLVERNNPKYSAEVRDSDLRKIKIQSAIKIAKLYGPAVVVGLVSIGLLTGSHVAMTRRNTALMAAYATLEKGFREYEARVREEFGEDKARELRFGADEREVYSEAENGEPKVDRVKFAAGKSMYARFFDKHNENFQPTVEYNLLFLQGVQKYLNDKLNANGWILLNDAYDALGMERSKEGTVMGWVLHPNTANYVDFGINSPDNVDRVADFLCGVENAILVDFNVTNVFDKI